MKFTVLRVRYIVFLALVYLILVCLLYHYLWQDGSLGKLLETPAGFKGTVEQDLEYEELYYPADPGEAGEPGKVEFNFRRNPAPKGVKIFKGPRKRPRNSSRKSIDVPKPTLSHSLPGITTNLTKSGIVNLSPRAKPSKETNVSFPAPNYCMHAFYYAWYGSIETDGRYMHWNHRYLPHWKESITKKYPQGRHVPPDDIGASFYPELGCYSSQDRTVIEAHMRWLSEAGLGVIVVSWYPPGLADDEGPPPDPLIPLLLDAALAHRIKLALHIEPYKGRTPQSVYNDLQYFHSHYANHPAFYKLDRVDISTGAVQKLPMVYIYDSYLSKAKEWAEIFKADGALTVRGTELDCVAIALLVDKSHMDFAVDGGFDGIYTYFAADKFSFGSTQANWATVREFATRNGLLFIPSFGPGYDDLQVRPWNKMTTRNRKNGEYYKESFKKAVGTNRGGIISITSFNEWGEGTQIEPAVPKTSSGRQYLDYAPGGPDYYLQLTRDMTEVLNSNCGIT